MKWFLTWIFVLLISSNVDATVWSWRFTGYPAPYIGPGYNPTSNISLFNDLIFQSCNYLAGFNQFGINLGSAGMQRSYISCLDTMGNLKWLNHIYGPSQHRIRYVEVNQSNELIVVGQYDSILKSNSFALGIHSGNRIFVLKYSLSGNFISAKDLGPGTVTASCLDWNDNLYISGSNGLTKYDNNLIPIWNHPPSYFSTGTISTIEYSELDSSIVVSGKYNLNMFVGPYVLNGSSSNWGNTNVFAGKFTEFGGLIWLKHIGFAPNGDFLLTSIDQSTGEIFYLLSLMR